MKLEITHRVAIEIRDLAPLLRQYLQERLPRYDFDAAKIEWPEGRLIVNFTEVQK